MHVDDQDFLSFILAQSERGIHVYIDHGPSADPIPEKVLLCQEGQPEPQKSSLFSLWHLFHSALLPGY
jgi:hypothetical protein